MQFTNILSETLNTTQQTKICSEEFSEYSCLMVQDSLYHITKNSSIYGEKEWNFTSRSRWLCSAVAHQKERSWETSSFEFSLVTVVVSLGFVHFFTGLLLFFLTGHTTTSAHVWLAMNYLQTIFPALITQPTSQITLSFSRRHFICTKQEDFLSCSMIYYVWIFCIMCKKQTLTWKNNVY